MKTLFEYKNWLNTHSEVHSSYKHYLNKYNTRKNLLNLFGKPFFTEIKQSTENIQKILKEKGFKDNEIDGLLKALFIEGIELFLNLDYKISVYDDIRTDDYYLGLLTSLKINVNDKDFLKEILDELKQDGENLPESPINILLEHKYNKPKNGEHHKEHKQSKEKSEEVKQDNLQRILHDFWDKDYGFIKDLRYVGVKEENLESTFLIGLHRNIGQLLNNEDLNQAYIDKIFNYYNIDYNNKAFLTQLKNEIESVLGMNEGINNNIQGGRKHNPEIARLEGNIQEIKNTMNTLRQAHNRLSGKKIMHGHCAFDDSPTGLKLFGENVIEYKIGDEYIPCDNHAIDLAFCNKIYNCSIDELEKLYVNKRHNDIEFWRKLHENDEYGYKIFLQNILQINSIDLLGMYERGERFEVIKGTYNDKEADDNEYISCRYVNIRSKKTGKEYRVLSK